MLKIYFRYGFWITIALIMYFLIFRMLGLHDNILLSTPNGIIFGVGIFLALKHLKASDPEIDYGKGFVTGFLSGAVASILFAIFMAIYMYQIDTDFAHQIMQKWNMGDNLNTAMLVMSLVILGIATSLILTLTFMQLLKTSWNIGTMKKSRKL